MTLQSNAVLNGFTVQNGIASIVGRTVGGGVLMQAGARIENSTILNNTATERGGGVFAEGSAEIFNSVIAHNRAGIDGFAVSSTGEMLFQNNTVVDNTVLECVAYTGVRAEHNVCTGQTLILTANTAGTYLWSTGETSSSITTSALTTNITFYVTITTPTYCMVTDTFEISVHALPPTPTAESITANTDCSGDNPNGIIVIADVAGMAFSVDGTTFASNRTFGGRTHGQYTIYLRNANNCVSSATVTVPNESGAPELIGTMAVTPGTTICNPHTGNIVISPTFTNLGTSPAFQWSVVGGASNISTSQNLTLTTAPTTTTTYRIRATNTQTGCHVYYEQTITVMQQASITTQPTGGSICVGQTGIILSVVSAPAFSGNTYQWQSSATETGTFTNIVGQTSSSYSVPNNPASALWYRVQVSMVGGICPPIYSNAVQVNVLAVPTVASVSGGTICGAGTVSLSATANPSTANIRWFANQTGGVPITTGTPNDGITASGANWTTPSIATPTTFWAEAHNGACGSTSRASVVAYVQPVHVITHTGGALNQNVCQGIAINAMGFGFSGGASGGTIAWVGPDGGTSAPAGLTATATGISGTVAAGATPGTYTFTITTTSLSATCPTVSTSGSIVVHATPEPVTVTATPGCGSTVLNATGGDGGTIFWQGTTCEGRSIASPSTWQNITANGTYFFNAQSAQGCWSTQGSYTITAIEQPHTLTANDHTLNLNLAIPANTVIATRGGSATEVTITWTGTADANTPPPGVTVSSLTATPITISGTPTLIGTFGFTVATVAGTTCPLVQETGTITVWPRGCNTATPSFGGAGTVVAAGQLGVVTWGNTTNTNIDATTGTGARTQVSRAGSVPEAVTTDPQAANNTQIWSGAVFAQGCAKGNTTNNNAFANNAAVADCRQSLHTFDAGRAAGITGDLFSWCAVMRFADQLCPAPWRVPTADDFRVLHWILTGNTPPAPGSSVAHGIGAGAATHTYMINTGTTTAPTVGGTWGGARFTGNAGYLTTANSFYWSSPGISAADARNLRFGAAVVWPEHSLNKALGFALRCVR